ncbi:MAG TPA: MFS transporter [Pseudomonadales bacterium]
MGEASALEAASAVGAASGRELPATEPPLTARQKGLYAFGDIADGIKNVALAQFLLYYLTVVCGLSGSMAGAALFIALFVDALTDPLVGYLSDNARTRWGRRHPFMFVAAFPFAIALGLLFSVPAFESVWARFAYVLVVLLTLRIAFSAFVLPYAAMTAELSADYAERSVLMTYRNFLNICANVATVTLGFGVFMAGAGALESREAYVPFGWVCAALVLIAALVSAGSTYPLRHRLKNVSAVPRVPFRRLFTELGEVLANHSFRVLALTVVVFWVAQGTHGSLGVHAFRHFWDLSPELIRNVLYAHTAGLVAGIPLCALLLTRFEKKEISAGGIAAFCVSQFIPPVLALTGLLPESPRIVFAVLCVFYFIPGLAMTCVGITFGSMMADATDEHELRFGTRREGLYFSGLTLGGKCAIGLGALIAGLGLDLIGFPTDLAARPDQVVDAETVRNLGIIYGPGAAVISFLSVSIMMRYRLTSAALARVQADLARRRDQGPRS